MNNNSVTITGTLVDIGGLREGTIKNGRNTGHEYIGGNIVMKCMLDGVDNRIPVTFFTTDITSTGEHSKLYDNYVALKGKVGRRVTWRGAAIEEHRYVNRKGEVAALQRIKGRFVNDAHENEADSATFTLDDVFVARPLEAKEDKDKKVYAQELLVGQANYNDTSANLIKLNIALDDEEKIRLIQASYTPGSTVSVSGKVRYITESKVVAPENEGSDLFGKAEPRTFTNTYGYFFIEHATKPLPKGADGAYTLEKIASYKESRAALDSKLLSESKDAGNSAEEIEPEAPISSKAASLL